MCCQEKLALPQSTMSHQTQAHREALQRQTQQDWANREYIELISGSIKRIADFLGAFDTSCRLINTLNSTLFWDPFRGLN